MATEGIREGTMDGDALDVAEPRFAFSRMEAAGALGDLGSLLPIAIGMIMINQLNPTGLFLSVGLYYIFSGMYFGIPTPVQAMKVVGAVAIADAMSPGQISASSLLISVGLFLIGITNAITVIGKYIPKSVVRGVQLSTGTKLMITGVAFMAGTSKFQKAAAEPYLTVQQLGPIPFGLLLGILGGIMVLLLLENRKMPGGLAVVLGGLAIGAVLGTHEGFERMKFGLYAPEFLPFGIPLRADFLVALFTLALPQLPMTIGNAVVANGDLCHDYFGPEKAKRSTYKALTLSMAAANFGVFLVGGMPLCHGAGGLAAMHRFGARTAGSNLIIGVVFLVLALFLGPHAMAVMFLMPMSVLGVLLLFAGIQLALQIMDLKERKHLFTALVIMGITLASDLAIAFVIGIVLAWALKSDRLKV